MKDPLWYRIYNAWTREPLWLKTARFVAAVVLTIAAVYLIVEDGYVFGWKL